MKSKFNIPPHPINGKHWLLVDDMSEKRNFGSTNSMDKIEYNTNIFGEEFELDIAVKNLFTDKGLTSVFPMGRFITVLLISKDEASGSMTFFDFITELDFQEERSILMSVFSENVVDAFFQVKSGLSSIFNEELDLFDLFIPNLSHTPFK